MGQQIPHISKILTILYLFIESLIGSPYSPLSLSLSSCSTPNYRTNLTSPISSSPTDGWLLIFPQTPQSFTSESTVSLPMTFTSSSSVNVYFQIVHPCAYVLTIKYRANETTFTHISINTSASTYKRQTISSINYVTFTQQYGAGQQSVSIWGDSLVQIISVSVIIKKVYLDVDVKAIQYPYRRKLILATSIPISSLTNLTLITSLSRLSLTMLPSQQNCTESINATTNPNDYGQHSSATLYSQSLDYKFKIVYNTSTYMPEGYENNLVLMVENVQVDCSVQVGLTMPGNQMADNLNIWTVFNPNINQTIQYIQDYYPITSTVKFLYMINASLVSVILTNLPVNTQWDIDGINSGIDFYIDDVKFDFIFFVGNSSFFTKNTTLVNQTTNFTISVPNNYLRYNATNQLIKFTFKQWSQYFAYVINLGYKLIGTYNQTSKILDAVFQIQVQDYWTNNSISLVSYLYIFVNGVQKSNKSVKQITNANNYFQIRVKNFTLKSTDSISLSLYNSWPLVQRNGYHVNFVTTSYKFTYIKTPTANSTNTTNNSTNSTDSSDQSDSSTSTTNNKFLYYSELDGFTENSSVFLDDFTAGVNFYFFSYFFNSLVAFNNLAFFYYFIDFKSPINYYRQQLSSSLNDIGNQGNFQSSFNQLANTNLTIDPNSDIQDPLSDFPTGNYNRIYDFGFYTDFLRNNVQGLISVSMTCFKLFIIFLCSFIPLKMLRLCLSQFLLIWKQIILTQIVMMAPPILIVLGSHYNSLNPFGYNYFTQKINQWGCLMMAWVCCISCFLIFLFRYNQSPQNRKQEEQIIQKKQKTIKKIKTEGNIRNSQKVERTKKYKQSYFGKSQLKSSSLFKTAKTIHTTSKLLYYQMKLIDQLKQLKRKTQTAQFLFLIDNFMYFLVPFCVGIGSSNLFMPVMIILTSVRLTIVITKRQHFGSGQFTKQLLSKILWFFYNMIYVAYWIIDLSGVDCPNDSICTKFVSMFDLLQVFVFVGGCFMEIVINIFAILVDLVIALKDLVIKIFAQKQKNDLSTEKSDQKQKENIFNNQFNSEYNLDKSQFGRRYEYFSPSNNRKKLTQTILSNKTGALKINQISQIEKTTSIKEF